MNDPKWKPIKDFINGKDIGFQDTQLGVDFINCVRKEIWRKYDFDVLSVHSVFQALHARNVPIESFGMFKKKGNP